MSIECIDGHRFDTDKAKKHWHMRHFDGNNVLKGDLYLSSRGTWYMYTPSQWSNGHRWELSDPADLLERYGDYFDDDEKAEIMALAKLETE
jgi:hypothetical protein